MPETTTADAGYFSEQAIKAVEKMGTHVLVPPNRQKHGAPSEPAPSVQTTEDTSTSERMRAKLRSQEGSALYRMRKAIMEPVFGQIKSVRGIRRFVLRGFANVRAEFQLIALTHNILKLYRFVPRALAAGP
jgi:hypothetical protein